MATLVSSSSRVNADSMSPPMSPLLSAQHPGLPASAASLGARLAGAGGLATDCCGSDWGSDWGIRHKFHGRTGAAPIHNEDSQPKPARRLAAGTKHPVVAKRHTLAAEGTGRLVWHASLHGAPCVELLDDPREQPRRGVVQRVAQRLRLGALDLRVACRIMMRTHSIAMPCQRVAKRLCCCTGELQAGS
jgi:hypothetical protein